MDERQREQHYYEAKFDGGKAETTYYRPGYLTERIDGEQLFQCLVCLVVIYFVARLFHGLILILIVGVAVTLMVQLVDGFSANILSKEKKKF